MCVSAFRALGACTDACVHQHFPLNHIAAFCVHGARIDGASASLPPGDKPSPPGEKLAPPGEKRSPPGEQMNPIQDALGVFLAEKNRGDVAKPPAPPGRLSSWDRSFLVMQSASEFL